MQTFIQALLILSSVFSLSVFIYFTKRYFFVPKFTGHIEVLECATPKQGEYWWRQVGKNGEITATSHPETFTKSNALKAARKQAGWLGGVEVKNKT